MTDSSTNGSVIETDSLTYHFGNQLVLDNISLKVPRGSVYAFLGPNGAGKTTTIKLLLHLLRSKEANIRLFGLDIREHRIEVLRRIGSLIEQPAIYEHLSGRENLLNRAKLLGVPAAQVTQLLETVHLHQNANKKAGKYSLGMKQRLGIALAMLGDPELLVLDEPTNGLDPNGIIEMRNLMRELTQIHGKTIFVSSHLLSEVEKIATHVGIIDRGRLLFQGPVTELLTENSGQIVLEVDRPGEAVSLLETQGFQALPLDASTPHGHTHQGISLPYQNKEQMAIINSVLVQAGLKVYSLQRKTMDLENLFLNITNPLK